MGLVLIYKSSGVFNFAQGEFGTVALCTLYLLHSNDIPYGFTVVGGLLAAMLLGFLTERVIIRPLFEAPRVTLLGRHRGRRAARGSRSSNGCSTTRAVRSPRRSRRTDRVSVFGVAISDQRLWLIGTLAVLAVLLGLFFTRTNLGLAIIGASQEPTATELVGISVRRLSTFTWVLAALLGGLAAVIAVPRQCVVHARDHDVGLPHPGVHGGSARRHDEPSPVRSSAACSWASSNRSRPAPTSSRTAAPWRSRGRPSHADRLSRPPRCTRHPPARPAREVLMTVDTLDSAAEPAAIATSAAPTPFRPSAAGWLARVLWAAVGLPRAHPAVEPVRQRPARIRHRGLLRDRRAVAERAPRLRRADLPRPRGVRRHRGVHLGLPRHRAGAVVLGRRPRRGPRSARPRRSCSAACRCASVASTSP